MATRPMFVATLNNDAVTFVNGDGTTPKELFDPATVAGDAGLKVLDMWATSDDTVDPVLVDVWLHDGTNDYLMGRVPVTTLAGTDGTEPPMDMLDSAYLGGLDAAGQFPLPDGWSIKVAPSVAITAAKTLTIGAIGGEY